MCWKRRCEGVVKLRLRFVDVRGRTQELYECQECADTTVRLGRRKGGGS